MNKIKNYIHLTKEDYGKAKEYIKHLKETDFQSRRLKKTNEEHEEYNLNGIIGELAFEKYCLTNEIKMVENSISLEYKYRSFDFMIENNKTVDVKTINKRWYNLMVEKKMVDFKCCDYYVLVIIPEEYMIEILLKNQGFFSCEIVGFISGNDIKNGQVVDCNRNIESIKIQKENLNSNLKEMK